MVSRDFPGGPVAKNPPSKAGDVGLIPGRASLVAQRLKLLPAMWDTWVQSLGREDALEKEMATHSSISCLENPMDGGAWWAIVQGVTKSWTRLSNFTFTFRGTKIPHATGQLLSPHTPEPTAKKI